MLRHRNIVILFFILLVGLFVADQYMEINPFAYLLLLLALLSIEFYGAYFVSSGFHIQTICKADTTQKIIALSFDDGPSVHTQKVLDVLDEFGAKATFFCIGNRIKGQEIILEKINAKGHLIGNHSYSHGYLFDMKHTSSFISDIVLCNKEIGRVTGKTPRFFRPPYGVTTPGLSRACRNMGLDVIGWNIRSLDTSIKDQNKVLARIKKRLAPGSIVLMHDTVPGMEFVVRDLLTFLRQNDYKVVPLDQVIQKKAYV